MGLTGIINEMPAKVRKLWKTEYNDKLLKIISFRSSVMKKLVPCNLTAGPSSTATSARTLNFRCDSFRSCKNLAARCLTLWEPLYIRQTLSQRNCRISLIIRLKTKLCTRHCPLHSPMSPTFNMWAPCRRCFKQTRRSKTSLIAWLRFWSQNMII